MKKQPILLARWLFLGVLFFVAGCNGPQTPNNLNEQSLQSSEEGMVHFIDTGNSDAILIQQGSHAALIDGGDNDDETLLPAYLNEQGITKLDYVFATHPDADHIGGLDGVIEAIEVERVLVSNGDVETKTYKDFIEAMMEKGMKPSVPLLYANFPLGEASIQVMSVANEQDLNNCSLVLLYVNGNQRLLFMGDAGQDIEKNLDLKKIGDVDLVKVGHHGSRSSSNPAFIKAIQPEYAVITCGKNNKYGHPHQETLETLSNIGSEIYRTDESGTIIFNVTKQGVQPKIKKQEGAIQNVQEQNVQEDLSKGSKVYFSKSGTRYHLDPTCSNMKEPIEGTLNEVGERTPCEKCIASK